MIDKKFEFEFKDESSANRTSFEYDDSDEEILNTSNDNGMLTIYRNRPAFMALSKIFPKLALCNYKAGFHIHLREYFDGDKEDIFTVMLIE